MPVVIVITVWFALSVPVSVAVAHALRGRHEPKLVGMAGADAVYLWPDGTYVREPLGVSSAPR